MLGWLIGEMQKEEFISALRVRMVWKRNIVRLGTRIVIIHNSNKYAAILHWTFIHIARCVCERCQIMDTYEECLYCQEIALISDKKIKMYYRIWWILGEFFLTVMFWKYLCMILYDQDPLLTILLNQYMNHDCTCKMQIKPRHYLVCWLWSDHFHM